MSAALVLPFVWAFASEPKPTAKPVKRRREVRFYRKYTEAMLRRYVRMSMEAGKVPSLLGKEMFRGKVTSYRVESFEDVVIFLHDIEHCLERLEPVQQMLIKRIALQEFTVEETAEYADLNPRTVVRHYRMALDQLTRVFLRVKLMQPQKCCQGG